MMDPKHGYVGYTAPTPDYRDVEQVDPYRGALSGLTNKYNDIKDQKIGFPVRDYYCSHCGKQNKVIDGQ